MRIMKKKIGNKFHWHSPLNVIVCSLSQLYITASSLECNSKCKSVFQVSYFRDQNRFLIKKKTCFHSKIYKIITYMLSYSLHEPLPTKQTYTHTHTLTQIMDEYVDFQL